MFIFNMADSGGAYKTLQHDLRHSKHFNKANSSAFFFRLFLATGFAWVLLRLLNGAVARSLSDRGSH